MIKSIIFDFDGVILDSTEIKTKAFAEIYKKHGKKIQNKVIKHHILNEGLSRYNKILYYHKQYLKKNINDNQLKLLCDKFSKIIKRDIYKAEFIVGSKEFIMSNYKKYQMFISSSAPQKELISICKNIKIENYFYDIFGYPESKNKHIEKILNNFKINKDNIIFVGDSKNDYILAKKEKLNFIAFGKKFVFTKSNNHFQIIKFSELTNVLKKFK